MKLSKRVYHELEVNTGYEGGISVAVHGRSDDLYVYLTRKEAKRLRKGLKKMLKEQKSNG